jgi:hypothetical protein
LIPRSLGKIPRFYIFSPINRQKTKLLQSLNSRRASRTSLPSNRESTLYASDSLPQQSVTRISIFEENIEEVQVEKTTVDVPEKVRTFSTSVPKTSESEVSLDDDYTAVNLLLHKSEIPNVESFLQRDRKETLTKYEIRNLPPSLTNRDIGDVDGDSAWRDLYAEIQEILTEQNNKIQIGCLGWMIARVSHSEVFDY